MKQATVKLPLGTYLIQRVQEDANTFEVVGNNLGNYCEYEYPINGDDSGTYDCFDLPPGNWQLLGADPTALTEEEAGEIVNWLEIAGLRGWQNYLVKNDYVFPFNTATASIDSLAQSLGISKPYVILKNVEK